MDSSRVIPLTVDRALKLRLMRNSRFDVPTLKEHISASGEFCWQVVGTNEYAIGGQWRRRSDIGHVVEMTQGANRGILLSHLLDSFRCSGMKVVVVACDDVSLYVSFFSKFGFEKLDEIIELERCSNGDLPPVRDVPIRVYTPDDAMATMEVDERSFPWLWQNSYDELMWYSSLPGVEMYVAENLEGTIVGYAGVTIHGTNGHLDRLAVHPDWQHQGYGAALLSFAIGRMEQRGARRISLSTQTHNTKSQSLYRKFGFRHTFRSQALYGLRLD